MRERTSKEPGPRQGRRAGDEDRGQRREPMGTGSSAPRLDATVGSRPPGDAPPRPAERSAGVLAPADIEAIIEALAPWLASLLRDSVLDGPQRYVDAAAVAARFGVERDWVYAHKDELGALRLGTGRRARLRFDLTRVAAALEPGDFAAAPTRAPRPKPANGRTAKNTTSAVELIPYEA
jgi:hypothetical protein